MNNFILDDVEYAESDKRINEILLESRETQKKRLNLEKIPFDNFSPSISAYKKQAKSLQSALQKHKDTLLKQDKVSLQTSLHITSNIYGFENWQTLSGTMDDLEKKECNVNLIRYIENKYHIFLLEYKENPTFFNDEYLGNKEDFISNLTKLHKKLGKLDRVLSDERIIDKNVISIVIDMVKHFCYFYLSIYSSKFEQFVDDMWSSKDIDSINKFDPISFALDELDKLQNIFEKMQASYRIIYLIHATRILEKNNQSFQQTSKIINVLVYCIATLPSENLMVFINNPELHKKMTAGINSININEISERYYLV